MYTSTKSYVMNTLFDGADGMISFPDSIHSVEPVIYHFSGVSLVAHCCVLARLCRVWGN